jgi:hypothetical protein
MNRIVLIGNGFDLAHGLPTRYEDFINDYWYGFLKKGIAQDILFTSGVYKNECISLITPDRLISNFLPGGSSHQIYYGNNRNPVKYEELQQIINEFNRNVRNKEQKIKLTINNAFLLHLLESINSSKNWVDIENKYYKFVCNRLSDTVQGNYSTYDDIGDLNKDFEYVKGKLKDYLIGIMGEAEIQRSDMIWNIIYSRFKFKDFTKKGKNDIIENEFWKIMREIENASDPFSDEISPKTLPLIEGYKETFKFVGDKGLKESLSFDLKDEEKTNWYFDLKFKNILFLNFNYTDTEKHYIDNDADYSEIIHIHGELSNSSNPIIFGYGDELEENYRKLENLQDNNYLENIKSIKYLETDNYKRILDFINSDKYQIIILGHSCGNSDRTFLNTLFEHENCVSIKPYYYQYEENGVIKDNYSDIVRNISRSFTDKKSMRDKVVNKTYTDRFTSQKT